MVEAPVPEGPRLGFAERPGPSPIVADWLAADRLLLLALLALVLPLPLLADRWVAPILALGAGVLVLCRVLLAAAAREPLTVPFRRVAAVLVPFVLVTAWTF